MKNLSVMVSAPERPDEESLKQRRPSEEARNKEQAMVEVNDVTEVPRTIGLAGGISFIVGTIVGGL